MSRLSDLYKAMETLRKENMSTEDLEKKMEKLEEEIIKKEILPVIKQSIEPSLSQVQRELVLVVEYHPNEPIRVALSRKAKISQIIDAKTLTTRISTPVSGGKPTVSEPHIPTKSISNFTKGLRVTFPDGTVIHHQTAINTFIATLQKIGLSRIHKIGLLHSGYNLVSRDKRPTEEGKIWQHEVDGWYIYSNISNLQKKNDLHDISKYFKLGLKIEDGKQ